MSQENKTVKFTINKTDGQPQTIKVVPSRGSKPLNSMNPTKITPNPIMLTSGDGNTKSPFDQALESLNNIQRNIECTSKLVQLSFSSLASIQKSQNTIIKSEVPETHEVQVTQEQTLEELCTPEFTVVPFVYSAAATSTVTNTNEEPEPVMSYTSRRRAYNEGDPQPEYTTKRRKHADKVGKGLRHFSMKVCEKVRTKGFTSYNEVADELVAEFAAGMHGTADSQQYDQKNIRRRVYDALNVLMAMNIISKEKKEIRWLGLPTNSIQECTTLEREKQMKLDRINKKTQQLQELILQHISFKSLIERNKNSEDKGMKPSPSSAIHLPFIVVNTSDKALIDCSISNDKTEYMFNFNKRFQIHDDIDILKRMGLLFGLDKGECSEEDIQKIKSMVPKSLEQYVERMGRGNADIADSLEDCDEGSEDENEEETFMKEEVEAEEQEEVDGNDSSDESGSDVDV